MMRILLVAYGMALDRVLNCILSENSAGGGRTRSHCHRTIARDRADPFPARHHEHSCSSIL